jgi:hypothetical protein
LLHIIFIGTLLDFKAEDSKTMKMEFLGSHSRGGAASTIAPEIAFAPYKKIELNYTKADIWSLGVVLATMLSTLSYCSSK